MNYMQYMSSDMQGTQSTPGYARDADREGDSRLMRAENVARILGIDRSTVYRMAESNQLHGVKIGRQWRFLAEDVDRLLRTGQGNAVAVGGAMRGAGTGAGGGAIDGYENTTQVDSSTSKLYFLLTSLKVVSPIVEVASEILGVMMVITDMVGNELTEVFNPCPWYVENSADPTLMTHCRNDWVELADSPSLDIRLRTGPLGFDRARSFIRIGSELVGMVVAGGVAASSDETRALFRLNDDGRERVHTALPVVAARISRLCTESMRDREVNLSSANSSEIARDAANDLDTTIYAAERHGEHGERLGYGQEQRLGYGQE